MKLKAGTFLNHLDFDSVYCLLSVRNAKILADFFKLLDVHKKGTLNDIQFYHFMHHVTDLKKKEIKMTFDMLDWDACGEIGFEQFYMLVCILLSSEYHVEKNFIFRHSRPVFELLDMDGGRTISPAEFQSSGFLFNLKGHALNKIFHEFDVSGDENLNYKEFKMFTMACIDMQEENKQKTQKLKSKRTDVKTSLQVRRDALTSSTGIQHKAHPHIHTPGHPASHFGVHSGSRTGIHPPSHTASHVGVHPGSHPAILPPSHQASRLALSPSSH